MWLKTKSESRYDICCDASATKTCCFLFIHLTLLCAPRVFSGDEHLKHFQSSSFAPF